MFLKILVLLMAVLFSVSARADLIATDGWVLGAHSGEGDHAVRRVVTT
jgi:hypothetical protein